MYDIRIITDQDECQETWQRLIPPESLTDLWEVRACFHEQFQRPPHFLVAEGADGLCGLLPLSWIEESQWYGYFPGETWEGKTWLEQNRVPVRGDGVLEALLSHCPGRHHIRYLLPLESTPLDHHVVDEIGYRFLPPRYDHDLENYFQEFSRRSAKRLRREIDAIESMGVDYRYDDLADFDRLVRLNRERFRERSYFHDPRFRESFRSLMHYLHEAGWLRITTALIRGEVAAVDMGCVRRGDYTLLGGGTNSDYPGVAKLINLHHLRRACAERLNTVDFLCGDFAWKKLFHLTPRPLHLLSDVPATSRSPEERSHDRSQECVS